ncbi:MAG TPA: glycoside hydrolase family 2 TIM barrel-domain containing protein [Verrucomicrobiae bacterium]|nr:glycoside hydrolase family 2 TIM barrel-domain containing protein [Verrucomicrobiae bacterium]
MKLPAIFIAALLLGCSLALAEEAPAPWHPVAGKLMTRWAVDVSPTNALPEYPRPQLVRPDWLNLNGLWKYAIAPVGIDTKTTNYDGDILVPFPIESALSGVGRPLDEKSVLWYHRKFTVPESWRGERVRLHFGAVDWQARVIVNGHEIGRHRGGYDAFSFDITDQLRWTGNEEISVAVFDPTEGDQPHGKQSRKPEGIFYTPTSGIWETVWLEPVPKVCIDGLRLIPDVDAETLRLNAAANSLSPLLKIEAVAYTNGQEVARVSAPANTEIILPVRSPHLWSPEDPFLYDLRVSLLDDGKEVDSVSSYFGMRKIALHKDANGVTRMALNNKFVFQIGALDQGFWPDGIYTAATDEALRYDIEFLKRAGFNLARKHVKVEPDRWYYWCDKLGLLVWQDMPSGNNTTPEGRTQFEVELQRMVEGRRNHPSIIMWVLFNEGWGQYDTERLAAWLKSLDNSRLVDSASGWTDKRVGNVIDIHNYPGPDAPPREADRAAVLGEFGGLGLGLPGHMWSTNFWGYIRMTNTDALTERGCKLMDRLRVLRESFGLSAAVYTQTADVETECNGLLTYDRAIAKLDPSALEAAIRNEREKRVRALVPSALQARVAWKYTTDKPPEGWTKPDFDDSKWNEGIGGFGTEGTPGTVVNTTWSTSDIWLRRQFTLNKADLGDAKIEIHHDEDAEVYFNGVMAAQLPGYITTYEEIQPSAEALAALQNGTNVMAVHCYQTTGGQYIDAGIVTPIPPAKNEPEK